VLEPLIEKKNRKVRNLGQGKLIIKTTEGELLVERSNQVWQIDHTKLDILLVDSQGDSIGCIFITAIIDSYSGCVVGFHLGFEAAGSHKVALALRHAFLPKHYGAEYKLQKDWAISGIPEFIVTDRRFLKRRCSTRQHFGMWSSQISLPGECKICCYCRRSLSTHF